MSSVLSGLGVTKVSKKSGDASVLGSLLAVFCLLEENVSSTHLNHALGRLVALLMVLISNSSMSRLATVGLIGDPIAALCTCSKYLPWKRKCVFLRQKSNHVVI